MLKVYQSLYDFSLSTFVIVGGEEKRIDFRGGNMQAKDNGVFTTDDEKLQKAIENSPIFGKRIVLKKTFGEKDKKVAPKAEPGEIKVFANVNEAVEWLVELGCKKSEVITSVKAIEKAKELGYDLKFEKGE